MYPELAGGNLFDVFQGFTRELRAAGLPVSMTENIDGMKAIEAVGIAQKDTLRSILKATLVKSYNHEAAFDTVFDVYFSGLAEEIAQETTSETEASDTVPTDGSGQSATGGEADLSEQILEALMNGDGAAMAGLAGQAVSQFAGMEPGRPVGGAYYLYRTLRQLDAETLVERMMQLAAGQEPIPEGSLEERLRQDDYQRRVDQLRSALQEEIRRRLVVDRGVEAMSRTLRKPLPEDVEFMHASRDEMKQLQRSIYPLTRALAARLAQRRKRRNRGQLDFRSTVRHSLSFGGVPAEPKFRRPRPSKPEIMIVADISGSVASFARFTLQFVYAMGNEFSKVRSWVFIDGLDEVTSFFTESDDINEAIHRVNTEADVVWVDGHSDYGHALEVFEERHLEEVTNRTSVIMLGDARNNYHATRDQVLERVARKARKVYWLNPEPRSYWDTGDSTVSAYAQHCDGVFECRSLRQLQSFVRAVLEEQ